MTLGEMLEEVTNVVDVPDTDLIRRFNLHQDRLSRDLMFPQGWTTATGVTDEFFLPDGARGNGLLEVRRNSDGVSLPIMNTQEADKVHPGWKDWDAGDTQFIVFDPKLMDGDGLIRPVPLPGDTAQEYTVTYLIEPDVMVDLTDQPWAGLMDSYHQTLVYSVLSEVLMERGDQRWQFYYQTLGVLKDEMFQMLRPRVVYANNPLMEANNA